MIKTRDTLIIFFISGFTSLVLEVVWAKQACLIFGNTTLASAAVISAFMAGLALGSYQFGRIADKYPDNALRFYAVLEGGVGLFALCFPLLIHALAPIYKLVYRNFYQHFLEISAIRFMLSFLVLGIPTTLMGGTFPLLSRSLSGNAGFINEKVNKLYTVNLLGAMTGSFVSGFLLVSAFGLQRTSFIAAGLNLGIFLYVMIRLKQRTLDISENNVEIARAASAAGQGDVRSLDKRTTAFIAGLMAIHGFNAFMIQICWARAMALILGSSVYSFSAVLFTFLAGLSLGAYLISKAAHRRVLVSLSHVGFMEIAIGTSILLFIPVFEWLIYFFVRIYPIIQSTTFLVFLTQFVFCALSMIVPTFIIGLVFPATLYYLGNSERIGQITGATYAANTLGGIFGCLLSAVFFISTFGLIGTIKIVSFLSMLAGFIIVLVGSDQSVRRSNAVKAVIVVVTSSFLMFYSWDRNMFSGGVFIYAPSWIDQARSGKRAFQRAMTVGRNLIYYKDGISSTVSVLEYDMPGFKGGFKSKSLRVNGKTDASTIGDMSTQLYLGYIPLFAHPDPKEVLVIGLGAGVTLGSVTQFPDVQHIDCVEIEPAVVEANRFFTTENNYALKDPRVKLIIGDGRNHISFGPNKYDVIISEPSNPWVSGISSLYTQENYKSALSKLNADGIYCQWFHSYQMSIEDYVMIMNTFASVFPEVNLYRINNGDYFLLGSRKPIIFDYPKMAELIHRNKYIYTDLKYFSPYKDYFVIGSFFLSNRDLRSVLSAAGKRLNTDDHLYLEYNAPKHLYDASPDHIERWLYSINRKDFFPGFKNWDLNEIKNDPFMRDYFLDLGTKYLKYKNYDLALVFLTQVAKLDPQDKRICFSIGLSYEGKKEYRKAVRNYCSLRKEKDWQVKIGCAIRRARLKKKLAENPILNRDVEAHNLIAALSFYMGDQSEALSALNLAIKIDPKYIKNYTDMAVYIYSYGFKSDSVDMLRKAKRIDPNSLLIKSAEEEIERQSKKEEEKFLVSQGAALIIAKQFASAKLHFEKVIQKYPDDFAAYEMLARSELLLGLKKQAESDHAKSIELFQRQSVNNESKRLAKDQ